MFIVKLLVPFLIFSASGFTVFFLGSKLAEQELTARDALNAALIMGAIMGLSSSLGIFGLGITLMVTVGLLATHYEMGVFTSILLTLCACFLPWLVLYVIIAIRILNPALA